MIKVKLTRDQLQLSVVIKKWTVISCVRWHIHPPWPRLYMDDAALYQRHLTSCFAVVMIIACKSKIFGWWGCTDSLMARPCLSKPLQDDKGPVFGRCVWPLGERTRHTGMFGILICWIKETCIWILQHNKFRRKTPLYFSAVNDRSVFEWMTQTAEHSLRGTICHQGSSLWVWFRLLGW